MASIQYTADNLASYLEAIDLSAVPDPAMIETLKFGPIFTAMIQDFTNREPAYTILLESDPIPKTLEVVALREQLLRQSFNDRAKQLLLAFAVGSNLERLADRVGLKRELVRAADTHAIPPTTDVYESDDSLRLRTQLAVEAYSCAGSAGAYLFHTRSASMGVFDAATLNNATGLVAPGTVMVCIMVADGFNKDGVIAAVRARLFRDDIKPVTDDIRLVAATPAPYTIQATIYVRGGPGVPIVAQAVADRLTAYLKTRNRINFMIARSGILGALQGDYVERVDLASPSADFYPGLTSFAQVTSINLKMVVLS